MKFIDIPFSLYEISKELDICKDFSDSYRHSLDFGNL